MRRSLDVAFQTLSLVVLLLALAALAALIVDVVSDGAGRLSWDFITGFPSRIAARAGIWHALTGSIFVILVTGAVAVPIETMTAYIVQVSMGDTPQGTLEYRTIFAVGMLLFLGTFALNLISAWLRERFREEYS